MLVKGGGHECLLFYCAIAQTLRHSDSRLSSHFTPPDATQLDSFVTSASTVWMDHYTRIVVVCRDWAESVKLSDTADEQESRSVTVAVDGQETRLVFNEYSSFFSPYLAPVTNSTCLVLLDVVAFNFLRWCSVQHQQATANQARSVAGQQPRRNTYASSRNVRIHFRSHCTHRVARRRIFLQTSHALWSVCVSVCIGHTSAWNR